MRFTAEVLARYVRAMNPRDVLMAFEHEGRWISTRLFEIDAKVAGDICTIMFSAIVPDRWPDLGCSVRVVITNDVGDHLTNVGLCEVRVGPGDYLHLPFPITIYPDMEAEAA